MNQQISLNRHDSLISTDSTSRLTLSRSAQESSGRQSRERAQICLRCIMAQVKPGYETVAHQEVDLQQEQPRNWHGSLLNCCGLGLGSTVLGVSTAYITHYLPCVTFG